MPGSEVPVCAGDVLAAPLASCLPVNVLVLPSVAAVPDADGPVNVTPSGIVNVALDAGAVIVNLFNDVAVATPNAGVTSEGLVARAIEPVPVLAVTARPAMDSEFPEPAVSNVLPVIVAVLTSLSSVPVIAGRVWVKAPVAGPVMVVPPDVEPGINTAGVAVSTVMGPRGVALVPSQRNVWLEHALIAELMVPCPM